MATRESRLLPVILPPKPEATPAPGLLQHQQAVEHPNPLLVFFSWWLAVGDRALGVGVFLELPKFRHGATPQAILFIPCLSLVRRCHVEYLVPWEHHWLGVAGLVLISVVSLKGSTLLVVEAMDRYNTT